jgi:release factor glutamine methyltransferase
MTIDEALHESGRRLAVAGVPNAAWDAELLLRHVLGWERAHLLAHLDEPLSSEAQQRYGELAAARERRTPLQHLTQRQAFWRRDFEVSPDVLIPRPETEILVEATLARVADVTAPLVVDVGTGSGCIALSIACDRSDAQVHATDISSAALAVAERNAKRLECAERVRFHQGDLLAPLEHLAGTADAVVSNPPYVARGDAGTLAPEVRDHEPLVALFPDGAVDSVYRRLIPAAWQMLRSEGWLLLEVGFGMANNVADLCAEAGFVADAPLNDLNGIPRVVPARKGCCLASAGAALR